MAFLLNSPELRAKLFLGRCGPFSRSLALKIAEYCPAALGGEIVSYMMLGKPRHEEIILEVTREQAIISLNLNDAVDRLHFLDLYEASLRKELLSSLGTHDLLIDIGANIGIYTLAAAAQRSQVVSFEPVPQTFERLEANVLLNPGFKQLIDLHQVAVSDAPGTLELYAHNLSTNSGEASFRKGVGQLTATAKQDTLDNQLANTAIPHGKTRIKIDIEGHEINALLGAQETLDRFKPDLLAIEIVSQFLKDADWTGEEVLNWLKKKKYQPKCAYPLYPYRGPNPVPAQLNDRFASTVIFQRSE